MKPILNCLLLLTFSFITATAYTQTADEVINKYIEAIGGKEKIAAINSIRIDNSLEIGGNTAPAYTLIVNGKGYRNESNFDGQIFIQVVTDKSGWVQNPFAGINEPAPMPEPQYKASTNLVYVIPLLDYAGHGDKAEYLGKEKIGAVEAHKIKVTNKNNISTTYYFDPATYYIIQAVSTSDFNGQSVDIKTSFSDLKKTDYGLVVPYTTDIDFGGQFQMAGKVSKVEINGTVDNNVFEMKK